MISKFTTPLLICFCFLGGYVGSRLWHNAAVRSSEPVSRTAEDTTRNKPAAATAEETIPENPQVATSLESLISIAGKGSPISIEAAVVKLLAGVDTGTLAEWWESLGQRDGTPETSLVLRQAILRCWAQSDPAGAFQGYLRFPYPSSQEIKQLLAANLCAKGWAFSKAQLDTSLSQTGSSVLEEIIKWTIRHDPEHVVEPLEHYVANWGSNYSDGVAAWAAKDRGAAENWVSKQPNKDFLNAFTDGLAAHGLTEARAWIENRSDAEEVLRLQGHLIDWAIYHCSLQETFDLISSSDKKAWFFDAHIVERWAQTEHEALWNWIQSQPEDSGRRSSLMRQFVATRAMSANDWNSAVALANKLPTKELKEMSLSQSLIGLDPMVISEHFDEVPAEERNRMFSFMVWNKSKGAGVPVDRLLELMSKVEFETHEGSGDDYILSRVALRVMSEKSPEEAVEFAAELPSDFTSHVTRDVFRSWVTQDPQAAAAKALSIAEEQPMSGLAEMGTVIRGWQGLDPKAVEEWIASVPPGNGRDVVAFEMVATLDYTDPVRAVQWLQEVKNEDMRSMLFNMQRAAKPSPEWRDAVQGSSLSAEDKKTLLSDP